VYTRGHGVRVYFRADQDGYVTLFRVDTDGRVRVLFPRDPWEDNFVRGGREYEALGSSSRDAFYIDDYPGVGYLFAVVAADPFEYAAIQSGNHWDYRTIADGRVRGDPYVALTDLAERIVPENYADWDYDIVPYYVEQHYDYPRFLCYDCHAYASYSYWDPYWRSCVRFRIVVYDDPYYYPYRYYRGGRHVVFVRPFRPQPRFVFKDRDGSGRDNFVTRERERPVNDDRRRTISGRDPGVAGTTGLVPAPRDGPRRERPTNSSELEDGRRRPGQVDRDDDRGGSDRGGSTSQPENRGDSRGRRVMPADRPETPSRGRSEDKDRGQQTWDRPPVVRSEPRETPRAEPRSERRPETRSRVDPKREDSRPPESRAEPRRENARPPATRAEPRSEPRRENPSARQAPPRRDNPPSARAEPRRSEPRPKSDPELKRRKP
jgi:hypothetical protein